MDYSLVKFSKLERALYNLTQLDQNLVKAVKENNCHAVQCLVEAGADVNCAPAGWTLLSLSCHYGFTDLVEYLLRQPLTELRPISPTDRCMFCGRLCYQCNFDDLGNTPLIGAASRGHVEVCRSLLRYGICSEQPNRLKEQTALLMAAECGRTDVCLLLLEFSARVQVCDNIGMTPLYAAIKSKDKTVVQQLIKNGCNVNIGSQDHPPIFLAARLGQFEIVKMLCEAGCRKDVCNKYKVTPIYEAAIKGFDGILEYLLQNGWDCNKSDMYHNTPLHMTAVKNRLKSTQLLHKAGASVRLRDDRSRTAVQVALFSGSADVLEYYLCQGVELHRGIKNSERFWLKAVQELFEKYLVDNILVLLKDDCRWPLVGITLKWEHRHLNNFGILDVFSKEAKLLKTLVYSGNYTESQCSKRGKETDHSYSVCKQKTASYIIASSLTPHLLVPELSSWLTEVHRSPMMLKALARISIRRQLHFQILHKTQLLTLPKKLMNYITLTDL